MHRPLDAGLPQQVECRVRGAVAEIGHVSNIEIRKAVVGMEASELDHAFMAPLADQTFTASGNVIKVQKLLQAMRNHQQRCVAFLCIARHKRVEFRDQVLQDPGW